MSQAGQIETGTLPAAGTGDVLRDPLPAPQPIGQQSPPPPRHVAVIMDGNGRWAQARRQPRSFGHRQGAEAVREAVKGAREIGISFLTVYAFSSENWKRPHDEVVDLMDLLRHFIRQELAELHENAVRISVIGDRSRLAQDIVDLLDRAEALTRGNTGLRLTIALSYGSQAEIVAAARAAALDIAAGRLATADLDEARFRTYLQTADIPDPDLIIRTSGEQRLSNFLLWQAAYAELVFLDLLWPDFTRESLADAVYDFHRRERRFGAVSVD